MQGSLSRLRSWAAWELDRRIELTAGVRLIILDRFLKAAVLIGAGITILLLGRTDHLAELLQRISAEYNLDPGTGLWHRLVHYVAGVILKLPGNRIVEVAVAAVVYGLLEVFEGAGLLLRRRWAEYLVLLATLAFLPLEIDELLKRVTAGRSLALLVNLVIVAYLVWRKRLFLERPPAHQARSQAG